MSAPLFLPNADILSCFHEKQKTWDLVAPFGSGQMSKYRRAHTCMSVLLTLLHKDITSDFTW